MILTQCIVNQETFHNHVLSWKIHSVNKSYNLIHTSVFINFVAEAQMFSCAVFFNVLNFFYVLCLSIVAIFISIGEK